MCVHFIISHMKAINIFLFQTCPIPPSYFRTWITRQFPLCPLDPAIDNKPPQSRTSFESHLTGISQIPVRNSYTFMHDILVDPAVKVIHRQFV